MAARLFHKSNSHNLEKVLCRWMSPNLLLRSAKGPKISTKKQCMETGMYVCGHSRGCVHCTIEIVTIGPKGVKLSAERKREII